MHEEPTLRALADRRGIGIGAAVAYGPLVGEPEYARTLAREFNMLTPENVMKMGPLRPARDRFDFDQADALVRFAQEHGMRVRGHTLVWHNQQPAWLTQGNFSRDEMLAILKEHIQTVVGRYRGQVYAWDVVNEAVNDDGTLRDTVWLRTIGPEYIELAFRWAHEADPAALLFYNDYNNEGMGAKANAIYRLVRDLKAKGVPIHGVGWQMHIRIGPGGYAGLEAMAQNLERLAALGLQVQITELDVQVQKSQAPMAERLEQQATLYGDLMRFCLAHQACTAFVLWGFTDKHTWIPGFTKHEDWPLIFDREYRPKPAYYALREALAGGHTTTHRR